MKKLIVYFSRTGNSKRIAMALAEATEAQAVELLDPTSYKGIFGFIKGGYYAKKWREVDYRLSENHIIDDQTHVYLVGPVWASRTAPAIFSFLMNEKPGKMTLILNNSASDPEKAYEALEQKIGVIEKKYCISEKNHDEELVLQRILAEELW